MIIRAKIDRRVEDIIAAYESTSSVRCIGYTTSNGYVTMQFKEIEPEPEPGPGKDRELLDMIRRAFDALSDSDAMARDRIADEIKRRVRKDRWGAYPDDE